MEFKNLQDSMKNVKSTIIDYLPYASIAAWSGGIIGTGFAFFEYGYYFLGPSSIVIGVVGEALFKRHLDTNQTKSMSYNMLND